MTRSWATLNVQLRLVTMKCANVLFTLNTPRRGLCFRWMIAVRPTFFLQICFRHQANGALKSIDGEQLDGNNKNFETQFSTLKLITFACIYSHMNNNNDLKITSKEHDNSEDEKEVNESILMLGNRLVDTNYSLIPESCHLFTNSDQESTSGEEDVLGKYQLLQWQHTIYIFCIQMKRKSTNWTRTMYYSKLRQLTTFQWCAKL